METLFRKLLPRIVDKPSTSHRGCLSSAAGSKGTAPDADARIAK
jgi:hypothetical protein